MQLQEEPRPGAAPVACLASVPGVIRTVLVADDNGALRKLLCLTLQSAGYNVISAADGQDALALFLDHSRDVDLVVTDLEMPRMNGVQFACAAMRVRPDMKVLIVTGNPGHTALHGARWRLLSKPFRPQEVVEYVNRALERS